MTKHVIRSTENRSVQSEAIGANVVVSSSNQEVREPTAVQDALDRHLDEGAPLSEREPKYAEELVDLVAPPPPPKKDVEQVEVWLRSGNGTKVLLREMKLAEFEAATGGEVWTRLTDRQPVFMDKEELHAYWSVDTNGWGDSIKDGLPGDQDLRGAVE